MVEVNVPNTRVSFKRVIWCFSDADSLIILEILQT